MFFKMIQIVLILYIRFVLGDSNTTQTTISSNASTKKLELTTMSTKITSTVGIEITSCNSNSSSCKSELNTTISLINTTVSPFTTVIPLNVTESYVNSTMSSITNNTSTKRKHIKKHKLNEKEYCTCNFQHHFCEINCCCDKDCSDLDKLSFRFCKDDEIPQYDSNFCYSSGYESNTSNKWNHSPNSLFCIMKTNLPKQYIVQTKQSVKTAEEAKYFMNNKFKWPRDEIINSKEYMDYGSNYSYVYGEGIIILRNRSASVLEFPDSFVTNGCLMKKRLKYLENAKTRCSHSNINAENSYLDIHFYANATILTLPQLWNENLTSQTCPKNVCIPLDVRLCSRNSRFCIKPTEENTTLYKMECRVNIHERINICKNLIEKVEYNLFHNGTYGISRVRLNLYLQNISYDLQTENVDFKQEFELNYIWNNYTFNYSDLVSGNPGYIIGKPILIAEFVSMKNVSINSTTNETTLKVNETLQRDYMDFTKNFMVFPLNVNGKCVVTNTSNLPIEFGFNMIAKCVIKENIQTKNLNASNICKDIQNVVFGYWSMKNKNTNISTINIIVGNFGNANISELNDWREIVYDESTADVLNRTVGEFINKNTTLKCNITSKLRISIFNSREEHHGEHNQEKIAGTFAEFANAIDYEFQIIKNEVIIQIPITSEVTFFDITSKRYEKFAKVPSLDIRLPYDFFYPFVRLENNSNRLKCNVFILNVFIMFLFVI